MPCTLADIAEWVAGTVRGDSRLEITGAAPLGVTRSGDITLLDNPEKASKANVGRAVAAIVPRGVSLDGLATVEVDNVHTAFAKIVAHFHPQRAAAPIGRSPRAAISDTANLADDVEVHAGASIGDDVTIGRGTVIHSGVQIMAGCRIGEQVTIFPNVVLYENTEIGARSMIHAGAILGAYGFGYKCIDGRHQRGAQLGHVQIGEDVEIGANTTIDRGTYGPTVVGEGTKIDNQVMIAHNCRIGRHNMICSQVGIAGSSSTGDYVVIAGQAGVRDHVHIGDRAVLCAMAGIVNDVPPATTMLGAPATPERDQKLSMIAYMKLPEMRRQMRALELAVKRLQQQANQDNKTAA